MHLSLLKHVGCTREGNVFTRMCNSVHKRVGGRIHPVQVLSGVGRRVPNQVTLTFPAGSDLEAEERGEYTPSGPTPSPFLARFGLEEGRDGM